jgi:hypothetical protein
VTAQTSSSAWSIAASEVHILLPLLTLSMLIRNPQTFVTIVVLRPMATRLPEYYYLYSTRGVICITATTERLCWETNVTQA